MKNIFGIDSKLMQILSRVADLMLLNLLYLVCCIPVITIGAAQAGLYRAVRALKDPESDYTMTQAYFMGFKDGFIRITVVWSVLLTLITVVGLNAYTVVFFEKLNDGPGATIWVCGASVVILLLVQTITSLFHSSFNCTVLQLFRNSVVVLIFNLLQAIIAAALMWLPLAVFVLNIALFIRITPLWFLGYYGFAAYIVTLLFKVPFAVLKKHIEGNEESEENAEDGDETNDTAM